MLLHRILPAAAAFSVILSTSVILNENVYSMSSSQDTSATASSRHITSDPITTDSYKSLVVYYSLTGKTHAVAQALANELHADVRRVEAREKRDPKYFWWFVVERGYEGTYMMS